MLLVKIYKRPNTNVQWWVDLIPQEVKDRMKTAYVDTEKMLSEEFIYSNDNLTLTWKQVWKDIQGLLPEFIADPILSQWRIDREKYCADNKIESGMTYMEFVRDGTIYAGYYEDGSIQPMGPA